MSESDWDAIAAEQDAVAAERFGPAVDREDIEEKHAQASKEISDALPFLCGLEMPSTKHMEPGEKEDAIAQMLVDLHRLADEDGCIAAAWAFEFATNLRTALSSSPWIDVKDRMPTEADAPNGDVLWNIGGDRVHVSEWNDPFYVKNGVRWMPIPKLPNGGCDHESR